MTIRSLASLAFRAVRYELRLYLSLARWITRRPSIPRGQTPVRYAQAATPVIALWIFASGAEIPLFHVLVPWHGVRLTGLALGVWGLLWMLGMLASLRVHPHLFDSSTLRVRNGPSIDVAVPWAAIDSLSTRRADLPSSARSLQPVDTDRGTHLRIGVSGQVNVHAQLTEPLDVHTPRGPMTIVELSFLVDDPREFVREARSYVDGRDVIPSPRSGH